jgi:hypothetical protein
MKKLFKQNYFLLFLIIFTLTNCGIYKPVNVRERPVQGLERAKQNIEQGKGISIGNALKRGSTNYDFSTSNPMWRASLELLDFLPLTTVDYSGGIIITDWYSDSNNESLKITIRFLNNEIQTNSIKIIVHQKVCSNVNNCKINEIDTKIKQELIKSILAKASVIEKEQKQKK